MTNIVFLSIFVALPYLYAFAWIFCIVPEWKHMIVGFFLNKIFMPFLAVLSVSKMFLTSTNFAWGGTAATWSDTPSVSPPEPVSSPVTVLPKDKSCENFYASGFFIENPKNVIHISQ